MVRALEAMLATWVDKDPTRPEFIAGDDFEQLRAHKIRRDTHWSLKSTKGTMSFGHLDAMGTATAIMIMTGRKLWFVAKAKDPANDIEQITGLNSFKASKSNQYDWQLYNLKQGDVLCV